MSISLTPDQEQFVQTKLKTGKYRSIEEILEVALRSLDELDRSKVEWAEEVRLKINAAIEASNPMTSIDGEAFVDSIWGRLQQQKQA